MPTLPYPKVGIRVSIIIIFGFLSFELLLSVHGSETEGSEIQEAHQSITQEDYADVMECLNAMKRHQKEVPFIYLDTAPVVHSFLRTLIPDKNCYVILKTTNVKDAGITPRQHEALNRIYRDIASNFVTTDLGF